MKTLPGRRYRLETDPALVADVRTRVAAARFPTQQAGADWATGTPLSYMQRLREFWLHDFDWTSWETRINRFTQRMVEVDGETVHVLIEPGSGADPIPLVMTPGWPGSFIEFIDIIDTLAHPERHGGSAEQAFTVIIPSLPGYGLSPAPAKPLEPRDIARLWSRLMTDSFGVDRYLAYGSDWGSLVTATLAFEFPERLAGIMLTASGGTPDFASGAPIAAEEQAWLDGFRTAMEGEAGYQAIQGTKPQTLAYAQTDSPIGLAAWIVEKFQSWTVPGTQDDPPFSMDILLANIMLYWINGSLAPSWLYMFLDKARGPRQGRAKVPAVFMIPPHDLFPPVPRCSLERSYDVVDYTLAGRGHFPGMDSPATLVAELRRMLLPLARR